MSTTALCLACNKPRGISTSVKFCNHCNDSFPKQRKCEIPDCTSTTEAFYTHCTFHYHRLMKEMRHERENPRPYRSTYVSTTSTQRLSSPRRHRSRSPPPRAKISSTSTNVHQTVAQTTPAAATASKQEKQSLPTESQPKTLPPTSKPAAPIVTTVAAAVVAAPEPTRRIQKRKDASPDEASAKQLQTRSRRQATPSVIVEYECGACCARNIVTREVRYLQTFVKRSESPPSHSQSKHSDSKKHSLNEQETDAYNANDKEWDDILHCKNSDNDDENSEPCQFEVNLTGSDSTVTITTSTAATTTKSH